MAVEVLKRKPFLEGRLYKKVAEPWKLKIKNWLSFDFDFESSLYFLFMVKEDTNGIFAESQIFICTSQGSATFFNMVSFW